VGRAATQAGTSLVDLAANLDALSVAMRGIVRTTGMDDGGESIRGLHWELYEQPQLLQQMATVSYKLLDDIQNLAFLSDMIRNGQLAFRSSAGTPATALRIGPTMWTMLRHCRREDIFLFPSATLRPPLAVPVASFLGMDVVIDSSCENLETRTHYIYLSGMSAGSPRPRPPRRA